MLITPIFTSRTSIINPKIAKANPKKIPIQIILSDFDHVINFPQWGHGTDFRVKKKVVILFLHLQGIRPLQQGHFVIICHIILLSLFFLFLSQPQLNFLSFTKSLPLNIIFYANPTVFFRSFDKSIGGIFHVTILFLSFLFPFLFPFLFLPLFSADIVSFLCHPSSTLFLLQFYSCHI